MIKLINIPKKGFATLTVTLMLMAVVAVSILGYGGMVNSMVQTNQNRIHYLENKNIAQSGLACAVSWIRSNNVSNTSDTIVDCGHLVKIRPINESGSVFHTIESYSYNQESDKNQIGTVFASQAVIIAKGYSTAPDAGLIAGGDVNFTANGSSNASADTSQLSKPFTPPPLTPSGVISAGVADVCEGANKATAACLQYQLENKHNFVFNGGSPSSHYLSGINKNAFDIQASSCDVLTQNLNGKSVWIDLGAGITQCVFKTSQITDAFIVINKSAGDEDVTLKTSGAGGSMDFSGLMAFIDSRENKDSQDISLKFDFTGSLKITGAFISDAKVSNGNGSFALHYDYNKLKDIEEKVDVGAMAMKGTWYDFYQ